MSGLSLISNALSWISNRLNCFLCLAHVSNANLAYPITMARYNRSVKFNEKSVLQNHMILYFSI